MSERTDTGLAWRLDARTKLIMLLVVCISASVCRDVVWGSVLFACTLIFSLAIGRYRLAVKFLIGYVAIFGLVALTTGLSPEIGARVALILQSFRAAFPPLLLAALLVTTTKTGDLVASLYAFRLPHTLVIPLAVGIRFFPTFAEEFRYVSDATRLQGLRFAPAGIVSHPVALFEALIVPLMLRSAKIAEELAAAAVTRGIEKPGARTSFNPLSFSPADITLLIAFCGVCVIILTVRFVSQGVAP